MEFVVLAPLALITATLVAAVIALALTPDELDESQTNTSEV